MPAPLAYLVIALLADQSPREIVAKMAANLENAVDARRQFVYEQTVSGSALNSGSPVLLLERRRYIVLPSANGSARAFRAFSGACWNNGNQTRSFKEPGFGCRGLSSKDGALGKLANDLTEHETSKDGIPYWLFPLRPQYLKFFQFSLRGESVLNGRPAYMIDFGPIRGVDFRSRQWYGTVWIDTEEYQLARISTPEPGEGQSGELKFQGEKLKRAKFTISYQRVAKDVWFPATYCNWLYFGQKRVAVGFENGGFRKADVRSSMESIDSDIHYRLPD